MVGAAFLFLSKTDTSSPLLLASLFFSVFASFKYADDQTTKIPRYLLLWILMQWWLWAIIVVVVIDCCVIYLMSEHRAVVHSVLFFYMTRDLDLWNHIISEIMSFLRYVVYYELMKCSWRGDSILWWCSAFTPTLRSASQLNCFGQN